MRKASIVATVAAVAALAVAAVGVAAAAPARNAGVKTIKAKPWATVQVTKGQHFHVVLRGNFTTGYDWRLVSGAGSIVKQDGQREYEPDSSAMGSPGTLTIQYKAVGVGHTTLVFKYKQWFNKKQAAYQTYAVCIDSAVGSGGGGQVTIVGKPLATQIVVQAGQPFDIALPANPSTGYMWKVQTLSAKIVGSNGDPTFVAESELDGAPGIETWHFVAKAKGSTNLLMVQSSPNPAGAPGAVYATTIVVK